MYLLNQAVYRHSCCIYQFTFHYVSIKSKNDRSYHVGEAHLHSTMYLLNRDLVDL